MDDTLNVLVLLVSSKVHDINYSTMYSVLTLINLIIEVN